MKILRAKKIKSKHRKPKKIARLDPVLKEIFQKSISEIIKLITNQKPQKISYLPEELRFVKQMRTDLLLSVKTKAGSHIFHFEIQTTLISSYQRKCCFTK